MQAHRGLRYRWHKLLRKYVCARYGHRWRTVGRMTFCRRCRQSA